METCPAIERFREFNLVSVPHRTPDTLDGTAPAYALVAFECGFYTCFDFATAASDGIYRIEREREERDEQCRREIERTVYLTKVLDGTSVLASPTALREEENPRWARMP
jgi:hypothetical protein